MSHLIASDLTVRLDWSHQMPGMFSLRTSNLSAGFITAGVSEVAYLVFTAWDNYFNFATDRAGNELNKLLPGVLLFC